MSDVQATVVARVQLFLFHQDTGQYQEYGHVGCAIMGNTATVPATFQLGCYNEAGEYLCTATVTPSNDTGAQLALQGNGYVSFKDNQGRLWSMLFPSENEAISFAGHFAIAMYGAALQPEGNIIVCDVSAGKKERTAFANDKVKVRFWSWVVQRATTPKEVAKLGSSLESNEHDDKPYMFSVPPNHSSVTPDMRGFEGMLVGMGEDGRRVVVVPQAAKRGSGPNVNMCYFIHLVKKKEDEKSPVQNYGAQNQPQRYVQPQVQVQGYAGAPPLAIEMSGGPVVTSAERPSEPAPPVVVVKQAPPPPAGFNADQMAIIDRMRDQASQVLTQIKEATSKVDLFAHDFKSELNKVKPQSLGSAQLEHTIRTLIVQTEDNKEELHKKDELLKLVEGKNQDLQRKLDKFTETARQLGDDQKSALNANSETKIELDRQILSMQSDLTRLMGEREDVARHLATVKKLLEVSDTDMKTEKSKLQVAEVQFQTSEAKLASVQEQFTEENGRRKLLEAKAVGLSDSLRAIMEEFRTKEGQIEERRRKMEADKVHYTQLLEEERQQAAAELRSMREELVEELATRDARYQEERARVGQDSFDRGRRQGLEDGEAESLLEADNKIQQLTLDAQRSRAEIESVKIKIRQMTEQNEANKRRLDAQVSALTRVVDDLTGQNTGMNLEIDSLCNARAATEETMFDQLAAAIRGMSRPIGKKDLLQTLHMLRTGRPVDYSFEQQRDAEEAEREEHERQQVKAWVQAVLQGGTTLQCPPMQTRAAPEHELPAPGMPSEALTEEALTKASDSLAAVDLAAIEKRSKELLKEIGSSDPTLGLLPPEPPKPTPAPTPAPQATPAPTPAEQTAPAAGAQKTLESEPVPSDEKKQPPEQNTHVERDSADEDEEKEDHHDVPHEDQQVAPNNERPAAPESKNSQSEEDEGPHVEEAPQVPAPKSPASSEEYEAPKLREEPQDDKQGAAKDEQEPEEESEERVVAAPVVAAPSVPAPQPEEVRPAPQPKAAAQETKGKGMFDDSDEDSDTGARARPAPKPTAKTVAPPKRAAAASAMFDDDGDEEESKPAQSPKKAAAAKPKSAVAGMFGDDEDEEDSKPVVARPAPKKRSLPAPAKKGTSARKGMFDDSDED